MPFEARKANFTVFLVNHELYNLIKSAIYQEIGVYINTNLQMSKTAAESWSSLAFNSYNLHRPKWTEQKLPASRIDRTSNKLGHDHELASTSTCEHFNITSISSRKTADWCNVNKEAVIIAKKWKDFIHFWLAEYRPFRNSSGNWGEFRILTNR